MTFKDHADTTDTILINHHEEHLRSLIDTPTAEHEGKFMEWGMVMG
jgi:hypothetical protein